MEGNFVWATNPETGETELKPVVQLFRNETDEWVHVTVNGEEIVCTSEHPFYSPVKGWTAACRLRAGDILVLVNGEYVVVEQVQHELLESPVATYNFEVQMESYDSTSYSEARVKLEFVLPLTSDQAVFDQSAMAWMRPPTPLPARPRHASSRPSTTALSSSRAGRLTSSFTRTTLSAPR